MAKDPASIEAQQEAEDKIRDITLGIELAVFAVIAERLGKLEGQSWRDIYAVMPKDLARIQEVIESGQRKLLSASTDVLEGMAAANDTWMGYYYAVQGVEQTAFKQNSKLNSILMDKIGKVHDAIRAEVNTSVLGVVSEKNGIKEFHNIEEAYKLLISDAASQMASGTIVFDNAVEEVTKTLTDSGLKVYYPDKYTVREYTGKNTPVKIVEKVREKPLVRNLYSSVTSNVMQSYRVAMVDMRMVQGEEFGADAVRVSAHALCAPDHLEFQGNIYTNEEFKEIQSTLPRQLVVGGNCAHTITPTIYDIAIRGHDSAYTNKLNRLSEKKVTFTGLSGKKLTMSRYEASQYQRNLENSIRKAKQQAYLAELENKSTAALNAEATRLTSEYRRISKQAGLSTRSDRLRV